MAVPQYTGSVSVPSLGFFTSATSVPATFLSAIQSGPSFYSSISVGDIEASRSTLGGAIVLGGATERGVLDFGIANAHTTTLYGIGGSATGNFQVNGTIQAQRNNAGTASYVPPAFLANGTAVNSQMHIVADSVVAGGSTTTITLQAAAIFASSSSYSGYALDVTTGTTIAPISTINGSTFSFASTTGHRYNFFCIGF